MAQSKKTLNPNSSWPFPTSAPSEKAEGTMNLGALLRRKLDERETGPTFDIDKVLTEYPIRALADLQMMQAIHPSVDEMMSSPTDYDLTVVGYYDHAPVVLLADALAKIKELSDMVISLSETQAVQPAALQQQEENNACQNNLLRVATIPRR